MHRLEAFITNLERSRLVPLERLAEVRGAASIDPQAPDAAIRLARELVERGLLTRYQANKILNGRTWGFFLGDYRILQRLGEGGMGKVYLARRERDGLKVAIKVLPPKKVLEDPHMLERFYREMRMSQCVRHPNLTATLEVGAVKDAHFMVMEYVPGGSLYQVVKRSKGGGPLRVPDVARFMIQVLDGLHAAHEAGLIHRDIKPSNLMITPQGRAKILDLGLARALNEESPLTHPNAVVGTVDYASPEQLANASKADRRSDLYSLGCTIYFALAGRAPFEGGDIVSKIFRHRMEEPEPLEQVAPGVPAAFAAIVRRLMAKDPADRYADCPELRHDLERWTDTKRAEALLGSKAEEARAFRPPPPEIDDEDLRLERDPSQISGMSLLRELGEAESTEAPLAPKPEIPRPAIILDDTGLDAAAPAEFDAPPPLGPRVSGSNDLQWVIRFTIIAVCLGLAAVLTITLFNWT